jgi:hypothetical protein
MSAQGSQKRDGVKKSPHLAGSAQQTIRIRGEHARKILSRFARNNGKDQERSMPAAEREQEIMRKPVLCSNTNGCLLNRVWSCVVLAQAADSRQ